MCEARGSRRACGRCYGPTEDAILARAALVFAWSAPLRDRLAALHPNVVLAAAAADLEPFSRVAGQRGEERVAAWTGAVDFRCDTDLLADAAERLSGWRFLVAGPVLERAARVRLASTPNVELLGPLPPAEVPSLIARARVCLMPYRRNEFTDACSDQARRVPRRREARSVDADPDSARVLRRGRGGQRCGEFAAAIERCAASDSGEARSRRARRAAPYSWEARIDQMETALREALGDG